MSHLVLWRFRFQTSVLHSDSSIYCLPAVSSALSWEGSSWPKQHQELTEHLCQGGLHQDSIRRRFTFDEKNVLLQWSNLQPSRWTSKQSTEPVPPALCSGYYQLTILGKQNSSSFRTAALNLKTTHLQIKENCSERCHFLKQNISVSFFCWSVSGCLGPTEIFFHLALNQTAK